LVSTDIAGFFENIPYTHFKKQLQQMCNNDESQPIELLNIMLRKYSESGYSGMPQNYDPFSYLCSAFLDFLDKELEAKSLKHFRYVDDIKVACKTKTEAKKVIVHIIQPLRTVHLNLSAAKTDIIPVNTKEFNDMLKDFPSFLHDIDSAVHNKQKRTINNLYPELVKYTKELMKLMKHKNKFDERLFRACIWRIVKINYFKNIDKLNLDSIGKACLKLLDSMPSRTNTFLRFLVLHKNRAYVQYALYALLQDSVYPWQEMLIWYLLIQCDKIKNINILPLAKQRARDNGYDEAARNYIYIFLGKHGDYEDRRYMANLFPLTQSFRAQRSILIAIQEYQDRNAIYNQITSANSDLILVSLVKYIKQLPTPEYVDVDKNIASDIAFS
jgi:Reverse transcriptase (RNA-dependent DNA polymerase)